MDQMSATFSYDEAVADSAHGDLAGIRAGLQASLSDLSGFVSRVRASWQGDEQEEYAAIQAKWDAAAATVREILDSVHSALGSNTSSVQSMRSQVRTALQGH
jgi:WXG100 family type VII secretion target